MIFFLIILLLNEKTAEWQECGEGQTLAGVKIKPSINSELMFGFGR
jgi:hypothetical protein